MERPIVYIVSADAAVRDSARQLVEAAGLPARTFISLPVFLDTLTPSHRGCLVLDVYLGDLSDPQQQAGLAAACVSMPGLLIVDRGDVPMAVQAVKAGAMEIVQKPYADESLLGGIKHALETDATTHS